MSNERLYQRLARADAWAIIGPVRWYRPTTNLKAMFDRLVCMSGGNPQPDLIDKKSTLKAQALEKSPLWKQLTKNHLEGRSAAFFCYGNELDDRRPRILGHRDWFAPSDEPYQGNERKAYPGARLAVPLRRHRGAGRPLAPCLG